MYRHEVLGRRQGQRRGTVAAVVALLTPVVVGVTALTLDGGLMYLQSRKAQSIADAAALAGAYAYYNTSNVTAAENAAMAMLKRDGSAIISSQVTSPQAGYIAVTVTMAQSRTFSALWGAGSLSTTSSATARGITLTEPYSNCSVICLDPTSLGSLTIDGGADLTTPTSLSAQAPVQVNSSSPDALILMNGAQVNASIDVVGGDSVANGSHVTGTITIGSASVADPLASLPTPPIPAATTTPISSYSGSGDFTLQPGLYAGDVTLGSGASITMQPGLYYFQGGSLNVENGTSLSGSGVTIYVDNGGGTLNLNSGTSTTLTPPSSGVYSGLVYFQDRASSVTPLLSDGATINMKGTFYAAGAPMSFSSGSKTNSCGSQMIVKSMNLSNGADIEVTYSTASVASKSQISVSLVK